MVVAEGRFGGPRPGLVVPPETVYASNVKKTNQERRGQYWSQKHAEDMLGVNRTEVLNRTTVRKRAQTK
jgi:hypothetical protein